MFLHSMMCTMVVHNDVHTVVLHSLHEKQFAFRLRQNKLVPL